ncbi:MAG: NIPSNAP family protein [Alphaproteobacteria bacterium]|jgi:hypothetical protein|nr:NIPSNAP family protein [Alphaproteobacteria bacterium]MDP6564526.1 NIPSNAP family protein [Alphaproteobacteria bacterium]MDP6811662.1 NIPSNAP family protein [Alphaproteobacteria bacterium]
MIHEMRTYTMWPGKAPEFLKAVAEKGIPIRGNDYGRMEGFWVSEFGPLNQVVHLWSHEDLNTRQESRARLAQNKDWIEGFVPLVRSLIRHQRIRLMHPQRPLTPPAESGNVYEYRHYQARVGEGPNFVAAISEAMPAREKYSKNVCLWLTEAGEPNEVSHLWAYQSLDARAEARGAAMQDPDWQAFLGQAGGMLEEMNSMVLLPAPFSPLG